MKRQIAVVLYGLVAGVALVSCSSPATPAPNRCLETLEQRVAEGIRQTYSERLLGIEFDYLHKFYLKEQQKNHLQPRLINTLKMCNPEILTFHIYWCREL